MVNESVYIPQIDGKDIFLSTAYEDEGLRAYGYSLLRADGSRNIAKYRASLDYSLDRTKLREIYEKVYRRNDFTFTLDRKQYCNKVINVTFKYSVSEFNQAGNNTFVRYGVFDRGLKYTDCVAIVDGKLQGIMVGRPVKQPVDPELIAPHFAYDAAHGTYKKVKPFKCIASTADVRNYLYENGFICGGERFVRWKRSAGSSRVGKCLFIAERMYNRIHKWEMCGLNVKDGKAIDLAALEAYIALPLSSIIDTIEIQKENILIIDDYNSEFTENVMCVEDYDGGKLRAVEKEMNISNCIWDGQGLIDVSAMGKYADKGMLLLRNRFFKCCCFNTNLQQWFKDNGITDVNQLNGYTLATRIEDVKLVTTPSSVKYLKFGTLDQWLNNIEPTFGVVKYDKQQKFFDGRMVQTHYQLLNTLQMSKAEVEEFLKPTFDYLYKVSNDPTVMRHHINYTLREIDPDKPSIARSKSDVVYTMLGVTDEFTKTKLYAEFRADVIKAFSKNLKLGHVLVDGNYSTLFGNPMEMLLAIIGQFDGTSHLGVGNIHNKRFAYGKRLLGSRSPHISMNSVWVAMNKADWNIDRYFNLTNEIVCINSIGENTLNQLSGCDFDSDAVMLTDNEHLIRAAMKNSGRFITAVSNVASVKTKRHYTWRDKADLDVRTSNNLIGDLVNLSQELNTLIWDKLAHGEKFNDIKPIYMDVCILNVLSQIEIDKAKKEFPVNTSKEMMQLREKYGMRDESGRLVKPNFFAAKDRGKGYYDTGKKNYKKFRTTMDYLQECVNSYRRKNPAMSSKATYIPFSDLVDDTRYVSSNVTYSQVQRVVDIVRRCSEDVGRVFASMLDNKSKIETASAIRQECAEYIGNIKMTNNTMIHLLKCLDKEAYADVRRTLFDILFSIPNRSFFRLLKRISNPTPVLVNSDGTGEITLFSYNFTPYFATNEEPEV